MYYEDDYFDDDDSFLDELLEDFEEEEDDDYFEDEFSDFEPYRVEPYRDRDGDLVESEEQERLMEQFGVDTIMDLEDAMDAYEVED